MVVMNKLKLTKCLLLVSMLAPLVLGAVPMMALAPGSGVESDPGFEGFALYSYSFFNTPEPETENEIQCILHHEYAVFVHPDEVTNFHPRNLGGKMPVLRTFVNKNGNTKYYFCQKCGTCGVGVRILTQCHLRQDIVCSNLCLNSSWSYDDFMERCYPAGASESPTTAKITASVVSATRQFFSSGFVFITDNGVNGGIEDSELPPEGHIHSSRWSIYFIPITVGVVTLNVMFAILLVWKRRDRKRMKAQSRQEQEQRNRNNISSASPAREQRHAETSHAILDIETPNPSTSSAPTERINDSVFTNHTKRVKESNLNQFVVNFQPGLDISMDTPRIQHETEPRITVRPGTDPFWIEMSGVFGPQGGMISCDQSDVVVRIPPGAIPPAHPKQLIIVRVSRALSNFSVQLLKDSIYLSPLVECLSPGLKKFQNDVVIELPHRAHLGPDWQFTVHYTDWEEAETVWKTVTAWYQDLQNAARGLTSSVYKPDSEVKFTIDGKYVTISTPHFSRYTCAGCGGKKRQLSLEAVVYVRNILSEGLVHLHCYLLDTIKDFQSKIDENEKYCPSSARKPLIVDVKKGDDLEVSILKMSEDWKVDDQIYKSNQTVRLADILRCHTPNQIPSFVTFILRLKEERNIQHLPVSTRSNAFLEAFVMIKQTKNPMDVKIDIAMNLDHNSTHCDELEGDDSEHGSLVEVFTYLSSRITATQWRPIYRRLMISSSGDPLNVDADISFLEYRDPGDLRELIYQMFLKWLKIAGRNATLKNLCNCLRSNDLVDLAEKTEEHFQKEDIKPLTRQHAVIETDI